MDLHELQKIIGEREQRLASAEESVRQAQEKNRIERLAITADKSAVERTLALLSGQAHAEDAGTTNPKPGYGSVRQSVERAVIEIENDVFSSVDVRSKLTETSLLWGLDFDIEKNRANIAGILTGMADKGLLKVVAPASGRRPAIYKKEGPI